MAPTAERTSRSLHLSADTWAVLVAFLLALLVRLGVIRTIPW